MGSWIYQYDSLGELLQQTDNKNNTSNMTYDLLRRMIMRSEPDMTSTWTYGIGGSLNSNQGTFPHSAGKLAQAECSGSACESGGYTRTCFFDSLGRQTELQYQLGSSTFFDLISYESGSSRIATVQYYSGYFVQYVYDSGTGYPNAGYLRQIVAPNNNNQVLWQADARDQELHLIESEAGGGLVQETQVFDTDTGRLTHTCASNDSQLPNCDGNVANFQYDWDSAGRLSDRIDYLAGTGGLTEFFCYDNLNRLTDVGGYGPTNTCTNGSHTNVGYDAIGNISQKTDAGIYTTAPSGPNSLLPHAVASVAVCSGCTVDGIRGGNTINFYYDQNGNLNCETAATSCDASAINGLSWTSFNQPSSITHEGGTNIAYSYDPEHNRIEMNAPGAVTKYLSDPAAGVLTEHMGPSVTPYIDRDYITADGKTVAIVVTQNSAITNVYYPILDHLGSVSVIVDGNRLLANGNANPNYGKAIDRYSYDAWGEARDPSQWSPRNCADGPQPPFTRGFTGQEHLPSGVCLINFNARIYNPAIGRFLSPDPTVEAPYNPQDLNRYSYVLNDPLGFTDPSGLCFLGCFWQQSWFAPALDIALVFVGLPWLDVATGLIGAGSVGTGLFAAFNAEGFGALMVANAGIAGGISGYAATGKIGGALISAGSAAAFAALVPGVGGKIGAALGGGQVANAAGYMIAGGMVGGLTSIANHQNFTSGFLSGGVGSLAGPLFGPAPSIQGAIASSVLGGFASVLGGGKFANGALTAAFAYAAATAAKESIGGNLTANQALSVQSPDMSGAFDALGKIWNVPNTLIGLSYGGIGFAAGWISYDFGLQNTPPDILFGNNAIQFTNNPLASLGAITFGNVEVFGGGRYDMGGDYNIMAFHEEQHTYQGQLLGPLYLLSNLFGASAGFMFGGDFHAPQNWNEIGPQMHPPQPWPW